MTDVYEVTNIARDVAQSAAEDVRRELSYKIDELSYKINELSYKIDDLQRDVDRLGRELDDERRDRRNADGTLDEMIAQVGR